MTRRLKLALVTLSILFSLRTFAQTIKVQLTEDIRSRADGSEFFHATVIEEAFFSSHYFHVGADAIVTLRHPAKGLPYPALAMVVAGGDDVEFQDSASEPVNLLNAAGQIPSKEEQAKAISMLHAGNDFIIPSGTKLQFRNLQMDYGKYLKLKGQPLARMPEEWAAVKKAESQGTIAMFKSSAPAYSLAPAQNAKLPSTNSTSSNLLATEPQGEPGNMNTERLDMPTIPPVASDMTADRPSFYRSDDGKFYKCILSKGYRDGANVIRDKGRVICNDSTEGEAYLALSGKILATPPRLTPINEHDPTGFDVLGIKLYMSAAQAENVLEKKYGQNVTKKLHTQKANEEIQVPGRTTKVVVTPPYVSSMVFKSDENTELDLKFVGVAPSYHLNQNELLVNIQVRIKTPTQADVSATIARLKERYGQPQESSAIVIYKVGPSGGTYGVTHPGLLWVADPEKCNTSGDYEKCSYPQLTASLDAGVYTFNLSAAHLFENEYAWEMSVKRQQMIDAANQKSTIKPTF